VPCDSDTDDVGCSCCWDPSTLWSDYVELYVSGGDLNVPVKFRLVFSGKRKYSEPVSWTLDVETD
jgi:hypothetical protein